LRSEERLCLLSPCFDATVLARALLQARLEVVMSSD
jgi:hypothetical protein